MNAKHLYCLSKDFLIKPYKNGVNLVKPSNQDNKQNYSIAKLYLLSIPAYFMDISSRIVGANEATIELLARQSMRHTLRRNAKDFVSNEFAMRLLDIYKSVFSNASMKVIEETGLRHDDYIIQTMGVKLPWYYENKVIGLLGWSISINQHSLPNLPLHYLN